MNLGWANHVPSFRNFVLGHEGVDKWEDLLRKLQTQGPRSPFGQPRRARNVQGVTDRGWSAEKRKQTSRAREARDGVAPEGCRAGLWCHPPPRDLSPRHLWGFVVL